ncbi:Amino acid transporter, transmembrane [Kalmanozyma brasiliensis GHG001]|nr:Amino acid transporter, transmembrane [Kalmanozyma brasiliensis GHG001]EST09691.2 Amino acid transporter, transmembrane [Kalmanozyma brasiliensis GHG001]
MASTGHHSPLEDRSSGSVSPTQTVDVEKNANHDSIKPHVEDAKISSTSPVEQTMFGEKREQYRSEEDYMFEQQKRSAGDHKFNRLGWKKLTICLIVEAIALGALSIPSAFATLGMVAGVLVSVGIGFIAIYTSYIVGQVKVKFPQVSHYADAGQLMMGRFGYELIGAMFVLQLTLLVGSHCLTGTIAFLNLSDNAICSLVFGIISAIILFLVAVPPSFSEVAILGYIDFASIIIAIGIVIIGTGVRKNQASVTPTLTEWSAWPKEGTTFADAWVALTNIVFAYSFAMCQFSFMDEMHTPTDYVKSIYALGIIEIFIYTITGALVYAFVGTGVQSPALLSAGPTLSKIAFGIALPVIFISGSINTTVIARYIHGRIFKDSVIRYINTKMGWITWLAVVAVITVAAWIIAEAIPFFSDLLGIMSALFVSGFTFYFPALMWFLLIKEGKWNATRWNIILSIVNAAVFVLGLLVLVCGTYASVKDIKDQYAKGTVGGSFTCAPIG